ncbi:hypothetical protein [Thermococcus sp.]|uniref:hypothetical protein n=1 Tax=Thermococcus sp. TaxID=35749 RepID=UPI0026168329|nr:hypothetical protein [Thermococcus sp.]
MKRTLAVLILVIAAGIAGAWYLRGSGSIIHQQSPLAVKGQILARLGAMDCYTYTQNITVSSGNVTVRSSVEGGLNNGTYYFHGRRSGTEWWGTIRGCHLVERVVNAGEKKEFNINLTENELSAMMMYEPVQLAIRALGSSDKVSVSGQWLVCNFTLPETGGGSPETFAGTIKVKFNDHYIPTRLIVDSIVTSNGETVKRVSFSADIKEECWIPEWEKILETG